MAVNIRPLHDRVIVQRTSEEEKTASGIIFGEYSGSEVKIEGEEYLILREDEILAIIG